MPNVGTHDSRDADDDVHLSLVADAHQISTHALTLSTSCQLNGLSLRRVVAAERADVEMPTGRTRA